MLVLRLQRTGRKNEATFRIVVSEKSAPAKSGEIEILGHYLPTRTPAVFECDSERVDFWMKRGAKPSDTLARQLAKAGVKDMEKYFEKYTKKRSKKAPPPEEAAPAPAAAAPAVETASEEPAPAPEAPAAAPQEEKKEEAPAAEPAPEAPKEEEKPAA